MHFAYNQKRKHKKTDMQRLLFGISKKYFDFFKKTIDFLCR